MSRRKIAVCVGLLISGWNGSAIAQQPGRNAYQPGQQPVNQPPAYSQQSVYQHPVYQQKSGQASPPVIYQTGFPRTAAVSHTEVVSQDCEENGQCSTGDSGQSSSCCTSYYRNARWPMPFRAQDVSSLTAFFDIQRENGWRLRNTVGNAMFDPSTNCLTQAGKSHIQSILRDNPSDRKVVFVLQGQNQQQTATRIQSTELAISEMLPVGALPPIYVTDRDAPGSSGAYQNSIMQALKSSVPAPRLTSSANGGGAAPTGTP